MSGRAEMHHRAPFLSPPRRRFTRDGGYAALFSVASLLGAGPSSREIGRQQPETAFFPPLDGVYLYRLSIIFRARIGAVALGA